MNEYNFEVSFEKGKIRTNLKRLVKNDYNTTKLIFTFDKQGRILFKMLYPDKSQYITQIENNELLFGAGILNQDGTYEIEVSLYSDDGKLTAYATKKFEVRNELIESDELVEPDDRVPVLDALINEVNTIKLNVENGEFNGKDGTNGQDGITPEIGENGNWFIGETDTGKPSKGEPGPAGQDGKDGANGIDGKNGTDGKNGADGYTPIRGTDYWTEADKTEVKNYCNSYIDSQLGTINEQLASLTEVAE